MSSRLMTMKVRSKIEDMVKHVLTCRQFMQRSAAKSTASSPSTPNGPPSKKSRLSNGGSAPNNHDHEILQTALAAEEKKQQEALDKAAQYTGETKWVLSIKDPLEGKRSGSMDVRQAGFAEIDAENTSEEEEEEVRPTRMKFGGGIKKKADVRIRHYRQCAGLTMHQTSVPFEKTEESDGEIESSSDELDSDDPTAELIRETKREVAAERREARKSHAHTSHDSPRGPTRPRNEDMYVGNLSSISGGSRSGGRDMNNVECYQCGQKGHMATSCPKKSGPRGSAGRGRGRR